MRLDHRLRTPYLLTPNAPALPHGTKRDDDLISQITVRSQRDPLNPKATGDSPNNPDLPAHRGSSLLEMPDAPPQPWAAKRAGVPAGEIVKQEFASALLKNTRPIFVYLPPGYSKIRSESRSEAAATEGLRRRARPTGHPETFGNVLSQSGSYWWTPPPDPSKPDAFAPDAEANYVARLFINSPKLPVRFYLDAGSLEFDRDPDDSSIRVTNRHLRDVLRVGTPLKSPR
jgi:enterochelin esterase-like enzyme